MAIPRPGEGKRGPQGHFGYLLRQASVALRTAMDRALAEVRLTTPQFAVLTMIVAYPGASGGRGRSTATRSARSGAGWAALPALLGQPG